MWPGAIQGTLLVQIAAGHTPDTLRGSTPSADNDLALVIGYSILQHSLEDLHSLGVHASTAQILQKTDCMGIPKFSALCACYLGMFLSMEGAFILMALREYLQDVIGLSEIDLITQGHTQGAILAKSTTRSADR